MNIIQSVKDIIGNYFLSIELRSHHRTKAFVNMEQAASVGILFDATNSENFELVKKYIVYLRDMKKRVKAIGFYNQRTPPPMTYSKLEYDFFSIKDLNWYNFPDTIYVRNFIEDEYDILLDLNLTDLFPLKYISALSRAKFKVGKKDDKNNGIFDMMIDADISKGLKYFLRNMDSYIFIINKNTTNHVSYDENLSKT